VRSFRSSCHGRQGQQILESVSGGGNDGWCAFSPPGRGRCFLTPLNRSWAGAGIDESNPSGRLLVALADEEATRSRLAVPIFANTAQARRAFRLRCQGDPCCGARLRWCRANDRPHSRRRRPRSRLRPDFSNVGWQSYDLAEIRFGSLVPCRPSTGCPGYEQSRQLGFVDDIPGARVVVMNWPPDRAAGAPPGPPEPQSRSAPSAPSAPPSANRASGWP